MCQVDGEQHSVQHCSTGTGTSVGSTCGDNDGPSSLSTMSAVSALGAPKQSACDDACEEGGAGVSSSRLTLALANFTLGLAAEAGGAGFISGER